MAVDAETSDKPIGPLTIVLDNFAYVFIKRHGHQETICGKDCVTKMHRKALQINDKSSITGRYVIDK